MRARTLSPAERARFHRHLLLPGFGEEGQLRLREARVLVVGAGGLGCPAAMYLAAAGVGTLGLVDDDTVDASNLQRQILFGPADVGRPKVDVARERLLAQSPETEIRVFPARLAAANALGILRDFDLVVDGSDNFPTRYLVSDACVLLGLPMAYGAIFRFDGQASLFDARRGPCYRCLHAAPPGPGEAPSCAEAGVLGVLPGVIAMIQATEALKHLAGIGDSLVGRLLHYDALELRFSEFVLPKDPACPACGADAKLEELRDLEAHCAGEPIDMPKETTVETLHALREAGEEHLLLDVREPEEHALARIEGARLVPLGELEERIAELADWKTRHVIVHCHHGGRSAAACGLLQQHGFANVENLRGGIELWSRSIDPRVPRY